MGLTRKPTLRLVAFGSRREKKKEVLSILITLIQRTPCSQDYGYTWVYYSRGVLVWSSPSQTSCYVPASEGGNRSSSELVSFH